MVFTGNQSFPSDSKQQKQVKHSFHGLGSIGYSVYLTCHGHFGTYENLILWALLLLVDAHVHWVGVPKKGVERSISFLGLKISRASVRSFCRDFGNIHMVYWILGESQLKRSWTPWKHMNLVYLDGFPLEMMKRPPYMRWYEPSRVNNEAKFTWLRVHLNGLPSFLRHTHKKNQRHEATWNIFSFWPLFCWGCEGVWQLLYSRLNVSWWFNGALELVFERSSPT